MNLDQPLKQRIQSIDILRGVIMLIMTLDHCREYFHFQGIQYAPTNMATTTVVLFFTRWVTHFCAPVFVFLSGTSAYLAGLKRSKSELSSFLIKRGIWLMLIDIIVITFVITINPLYNRIFLEVLWAIGGSMIILGLLVIVRVPLSVIASIGCIIFFGHNLLDFMQLPKNGVIGTILQLFLTAHAAVLQLDSHHSVFILYTIIPWAGVMFIGYAFGAFFRPGFDAQRRKKILLSTGISLAVLFIILRIVNFYGDPAPWSAQRDAAHTLLSFLNASKSPPSLLYLCMTLGPALILLAFMERAPNRFTKICLVYGQVPLFYFVVHLSFICICKTILLFATGVEPQFPLWVVYMYWLFVISVLYWLNKWYANYKKSHRQWSLAYL